MTLAEDELIPDVDVGDEVGLQNLLGAGSTRAYSSSFRREASARMPTSSWSSSERRRSRSWPWPSLLVVLFGRRRGALSLVGLVIALVVVVKFVVPAILAGEAPLAVALVGALVVMFATIPLTHGGGIKAMAAMLGAAAALLLTAALAVLFVEVAHITGLSAGCRKFRPVMLRARSTRFRGR